MTTAPWRVSRRNRNDTAGTIQEPQKPAHRPKSRVPRNSGDWHWTERAPQSSNNHDKAAARHTELQERVTALHGAMLNHASPLVTPSNPPLPASPTDSLYHQAGTGPSPVTPTQQSDIDRKRLVANKIRAVKSSLALYAADHPVRTTLQHELGELQRQARSALPLTEQINTGVEEVAAAQLKVERLAAHATKAKEQLDLAMDVLHTAQATLMSLKAHLQPPPPPPMPVLESAWGNASLIASTITAIQQSAIVHPDGSVAVDPSMIGNMATCIQALGLDLNKARQSSAPAPTLTKAVTTTATTGNTTQSPVTIPLTPSAATGHHNLRANSPTSDISMASPPVADPVITSEPTTPLHASADPYGDNMHPASDSETLGRSPTKPGASPSTWARRRMRAKQAPATPLSTQRPTEALVIAAHTAIAASSSSDSSMPTLPSQARITISGSQQSQPRSPIVGNNARTKPQDSLLAEMR